MSEIVKSPKLGLDGPGNRFEHGNKIDEYNLGDLVLSLYNQDFKAYAIARKCNEALTLRTDGISYIEVNHSNVTNYIKSKLKEHEASLELSPLAKSGTNLAQRIERVINIIEGEVDKIREANAPMKQIHMEFFIESMKELRANNELVASISGKLQPSITVAMFMNAVEKFYAVIQNSHLNDNDKNYVLVNAANILVNDDLCKPVEGKEIKQ